ncbi:hypothetical protein Glove_46g181 [Diversispora epigaea]|uniref:Uncharacterized protein n=1 Tax=Diversispora epigaea TaxID=1348612 RepID=A0A397JEJ3_9GLOM|nr:hypothetical protein Glove_46g181 [Diversispora epigaea]
MGFLEALKSVWMSSARDVIFVENSALRKRYCNILKRILSKEQENERVELRFYCYSQMKRTELELDEPIIEQKRLYEEELPSTSSQKIKISENKESVEESISQDLDLSYSVTETFITFGQLKFPIYYNKLKTI